MSEDESGLTLIQGVDLRAPSASAALARRAWAAVSEWKSEDFFVGFVLVPVVIAAGAMLMVTLLLAVTVLAPVLVAWLLWLAFRPAAQSHRPPLARRSTA
jgi:hypothetical protein